MRILVVEDDAVTLRVLQHHLEKWGHDVVTASDGAQAWALFQFEPYPLVLSDWVMPEMDGLELVGKIREKEQSVDRPEEHSYLILLTAKNDKRDLVRGMEAGADDFLSKPFDQEELRVRVRAGERIVQLQQDLSVRNAALEYANDQMKCDLRAAAKIQQTLLPTQAPQTDAFDFAWLFRPCEELAGDTLNVLQLDDRHIGLFVLDVTGHGVQAALLSVTVTRVMNVRSGFSVLTEPEGNGYRLCSPAEVGQKLNERFPWDIHTLQFFTMVYGVLDTHTRELRYISAGHPGPLLMRPNSEPSIAQLQSFPIGLAESPYEEHRVAFEAGDRFYLYSDGVIEALDSNNEQYGPERFLSTVAGARELSLNESVSKVMENVDRWQGAAPPSDDISILALECR